MSAANDVLQLSEGGVRGQRSPDLSLLNALSDSLAAPYGSVLQPDGEDRQGEEDVVTDTLHVAGRDRPQAGEGAGH